MAMTKKPVTGMKDILPAEMQVRDYVIGMIQELSLIHISSLSCPGFTSEGAPIIMSCAFLFIGKGITSRMLSSPARSITMRSTPGAIPAWGGAP